MEDAKNVDYSQESFDLDTIKSVVARTSENVPEQIQEDFNKVLGAFESGYLTTSESVKAAVEKARSDEKQKLYAEKEDLSKKIVSESEMRKNLEAELVKYQEELLSRDKKISELEKSFSDKKEPVSDTRKKSADSADSVDIESLIQKSIDNVSKEFETKLNEAYSKYTDLELKYEEQRKIIEQRDLDQKISDRRAELLSSVNGEVIEEMVHGSTIEELEASFEKAKALASSYKEAWIKNAGSDQRVSIRNPQGFPNAGPTPQNHQNVDVLQKKPSSMTDKELAKALAQIKGVPVQTH